MSDIPNYISDGLEKQSPATLRKIARRAEQLAERKEAELQAQLEAESIDEDELDEPKSDLDRDDAPTSATLTKKTIPPGSGNEYLYWQWSENGKTKSEYIKPVNPKQ